MKKRMFTLLATLLLMFAFSVNCFAAKSPSSHVIPDQTEKDTGNVDKSNKSPQTGTDLAGAFIAVITAAGITLVAKNKLSEAN